MRNISENELIRRVQKYGKTAIGNNAMFLLMEKYSGLVAKYAHMYADCAYTYAEAEATGFSGLFKAITLFDISKGFKLSTYATNWIISCIQRDKTKNNNLIQVPEEVQKLIYEVKSLIDEYKQSYGFRPSNEYIAKSLKITQGRVEELLRYRSTALSLDKAMETSDKKESFESMLVDSNSDIETKLIYEQELQAIYKFINEILNDREKFIIFNSLGLNNNKKIKLEEIAKLLGISLVRVKQIKQAALKKLEQNKQFLKI